MPVWGKELLGFDVWIGVSATQQFTVYCSLLTAHSSLITGYCKWVTYLILIPKRLLEGTHRAHDSYRYYIKISWIEPKILAANGIPCHAQNILALSEAGIRAILSLTEHSLMIYRELTASFLAQRDILYFHVPIPDQYPPTLEQARQILSVLRQMQAQQRPVYVHCHAGIGRTGTILHLYYVGQGMSLEEARAKVRQRRIQCVFLEERQHEFLTMFAQNFVPEESNK